MKTIRRIMGADFCGIVITAAIVFTLAGCDSPAMEPNETGYMYSDLAIEKAVWEVTSMNMDSMKSTTLHITLNFDEPVRSDRTAGAWAPFTVSFDYNGSFPAVITPNQNPNLDSAFTRIRGEEKTLYHFQIAFSGEAEDGDKFSNVRLSYMAPVSTKIVGFSGSELKNFMNMPITKKEAGGGMGGM
ncbi:MAG: hypothetical protein LBB98_07855 [Treponema sp.]|jgi:hypothetical protein|nr:hypothetical protein [Treponema sp.]